MTNVPNKTNRSTQDVKEVYKVQGSFLFLGSKMWVQSDPVY